MAQGGRAVAVVGGPKGVVTPMSDPSELLERNRAWATRTNAERPGFLDNLAKGQSPHFLWIGCADSRVSAEVIAGLDPGEMFVHRNVANVVSHSDPPTH